jgi:probable rRNA maturation factor
MSELILRNRQRARRIDTRLLKKAAGTLLDELIAVADYKLCIHLVAAPEMTRLNERFLRHAGSTDVITFDYAGGQRFVAAPEFGATTERCPPKLRGEIFICVDEAVVQARRFHTTWQSEILRYLSHGVLHLLGHDDTRAAARARMKREEDRLLRQLSKRLVLSRLAAG